jgi:malonyl-CoA O-methyltransferase
MSGRGFDKQAIARNFSRAASGYDGWARAQAEIATQLTGQLPAQFEPELMVDLGCGTGLLSALLLERYPRAELVGIDLAEGMVQVCRERWSDQPRARFMVGDIEDPGMVLPHADLLTCSCVTQWLADCAACLTQWAEVLKPGGLLACAFVVTGSFPELEKAYRLALGADFAGLPLQTPADGQRLAEAAGLLVRSSWQAEVTAYYESARAALRSFQRLGAVLRGQPEYEPLPPAHMRRLMTCYERFADAAGQVPVTYCVQYLIAERRPA